MAIETIPFDAAEFFSDAASQDKLIAEALETGNAGYIAAALGTVVQAHGMAPVTGASGPSEYLSCNRKELPGVGAP